MGRHKNRGGEGRWRGKKVFAAVVLRGLPPLIRTPACFFSEEKGRFRVAVIKGRVRSPGVDL